MNQKEVDCCNSLWWEKYKKMDETQETRWYSNGAVYDVSIDTEHPKKSVCSCPFAEGRRVICKHMVALYLGIFPEKEQQMMDYIEEQNQIYEQEYEQAMQEREEEIIKYVMSLSKSELREKLIHRMIDDLYY